MSKPPHPSPTSRTPSSPSPPAPFAPDLRYIKHLKSRREITEYDASTVIVCRLGRGQNHLRERGSSLPAAPTEPEITYIPPPLQRPTFMTFNDPFAEPRREIILNPALSPSPDSPSPFLSLRHIGFSDESVHLQDHTFTPRSAFGNRSAQFQKIRNPQSQIQNRDAAFLNSLRERLLKD